MSNKAVVGIIVGVIVLALVPVAAKLMGGTSAETSTAGSPGEGAKSDLVAVATEVATALTRGSFDAASARFDATMKSVMDAATWNSAWSGVTAKLGAFKRQTGTRTSSAQGFDIVFVGLEFEHGKADLQVTLDSARQVSGLFIR